MPSCGAESLSSHYWYFLDELPSTTSLRRYFSLRNVEVTRLLEADEDRDKLEVLTRLSVTELFRAPTPKSVEDVKRVALRLFLRRPSVPPRFVPDGHRLIPNDM